MAKVPVRKIQIAGGQTFTDTVVWCEGPYVFKTISALTLGWPTTISATAHGVPAGVTIPIWIQNAKGPSINTTEDTPHFVQRVDANTLVLLNFNTGGQKAYTANSATLSYMPPKDLTGYSARGTFRRDNAGGEALLSPTFSVTPSIGSVQLTMTPAQTRSLLGGGRSQVAGVAHVELFTQDDVVVLRPWDYAWAVTPEGTTES